MVENDVTRDATPGAEDSVPSSTAAQPPADGGGDIHSYIGARLRKVFDDVASQPVPDRFLQLMQELDRA